MKDVKNTLAIEYGIRLKKLRLSRQLTQEALAQKTDLNPGNLNQIEKGRQFPRAITRQKISEFFGDVDDLLNPVDTDMKSKRTNTIWIEPCSRIVIMVAPDATDEEMSIVMKLARAIRQLSVSKTNTPKP
jgi:transcriptional regulator with XRE-family HTH domain